MALTTAPAVPSFAARTSDLRRCRCKRISYKLGGYTLLDQLSVPHAAVYAVLDGLDSLTPAQLARPTVIKPLRASSAIGVMNLRPTDDGWHELIRGEHHTFESLVAALRTRVLDRGYSDQWLLEEPLRPPPDSDHPVVDDLKVYLFGGDPVLILLRPKQPRTTRTRFRWFLPDWTPDPEVGKHEGRIDPDLTPSSERAELLDMAVRVARAVPLPFLRVDTFATDLGGRVGEINRHVGGAHNFRADWDRYLGEQWEAAEARLARRRHRCVRIPEGVLAGRYPARRWWSALRQRRAGAAATARL